MYDDARYIHRQIFKGNSISHNTAVLLMSPVSARFTDHHQTYIPDHIKQNIEGGLFRYEGSFHGFWCVGTMMASKMGRVSQFRNKKCVVQEGTPLNTFINLSTT